MTKRNSSSADLDSPRDLRFDSWSQPMTTYRQRHASEAVASSAAAAASSSQGLRLPGTSSPYGSSPLNSYGYATSAPSVPMPTTHPTWHQPEYYPLQSQLSQNHRVLHAQIFKEVITGRGANQVRQLMATEIDNKGTERNRRPEFSSMESLVM